MITLSITEVCRRTGLSSRTLRFYEARGLLAADRTPAGLRCYGAPALTRLHNITALKRAGFTLAQIGALLAGTLDLARIIETQLATLAAQSAALTQASASLFAAQQALAAGRDLDLDMFCTLIKQGETIMTDQDAWQKVADRYYTPEEQAHWREKMAHVPADFDGHAYQAKWADLGGRIAADLPMDPTSAKARAYLAEWNALLAPFAIVADARMKTQTVEMYDRMDEWSGDHSPGFTKAVWEFIKTVGTAAGQPG
ncbi:MAG: MerR family transcriptional regulator [Sandarakinorhabdus sp.]|nr:MerR family transcriptional regulator [Sandarakinorhabdus sp.]